VGQYNSSIDGDLSINCQLNILGLGVLVTVLVSGYLSDRSSPIDPTARRRSIRPLVADPEVDGLKRGTEGLLAESERGFDVI
jgi:hypothetical protein